MPTKLLCLIALTLVAVPGGAQAAPPRPNIVVILADDMGYSDLGCYGSEIATPNLDKLAADGLRFTQFYNNARCCPTRASLLTGLYPHQVGVGHMVDDRGSPAYRGDLNRKGLTIAEALRPAGYRTAMSGKWHVTPVSDSTANWPLQRGFEKFFGLIYSVRSYYDTPTLARDNRRIEPEGKGFYLTDAITENAVAYLDDFAKGKEPFFLYVAYTAPHWPLHAPAEDVARYKDKYKGGWDELRERRHARQVEMGLVDKRWGLSPRDAESPAWADAAHKEWQATRMAVYAAMIDRMDRGVGKVLAKLKVVGREENTLVLFLSDNGGCAEEIPAAWRGDKFPEKTRDGRATRVGNDPAAAPGPDDVFQSYGLSWANASNTPFRRFKHWVHEGGIATPLIVRWPAAVKTAAIVHQPGHIMDILPTCLDVAGAEYPKSDRDQPLLSLEGKSLLPVFLGRTRAGHDALFWEHEGNRAVRQGKWKLVAGHGGGWELYDLEADRTERHDLAGKQPERVKELAALYERWAARVGVVPWEKLNHPKVAPK